MDDTSTTQMDARPKRLQSAEAAKYLQDKHGLPVTGKTLRNYRALGKGPRCKYFGVTPLYDTPELDRYAIEEALQDECPTARARRIAREASPEGAA